MQREEARARLFSFHTVYYITLQKICAPSSEKTDHNLGRCSPVAAVRIRVHKQAVVGFMILGLVATFPFITLESYINMCKDRWMRNYLRNRSTRDAPTMEDARVTQFVEQASCVHLSSSIILSVPGPPFCFARASWIVRVRVRE